MPRLTLTVDIPEFEDITPDELRDAVKSALVERVLGTYINDEDVLIEGRRGDDPGDYRPSRKKVEGAFLAQMRREAQEHLLAKVKTVVESRTVAVVDEILAGEFRPVDRFGDAAKPTTLRAVIGGFGTDYLTAQVDAQGRVVRYEERGSVPRLHFLIKQITESVYQTELKGEVDKAVSEFKRSMAGKVAGEITQTVNRLLGLPTA